MNINSINERLFALFLFLLFLAMDLIIGSRGYLIAYSILATISIAILSPYLIKTVYEHPLAIAIFLFAPLLGSLYAVYGLNIEFSLFQLARSQAWTILGILTALAFQRIAVLIPQSSCVRLLTIASLFLTLVAISGLIDIVLGTHFAPSQIRILNQPESSPRLYLVGIELAAALLPVFVWRKMYIAMVSCVAIIFMTGGKASLAILTLVILFVMATTKGRSISKIVIFLAFSSSILFYANQINSRIADFLIDGDIRRLQQINESFNLFSTDYITMAVGGGMATAYSEGYTEFSSDLNGDNDQSALLENSRFDIENGYLYVLTRFGILGTMALVFLLGLGTGKYRFYFIAYCMLSWLGGSPVGPSFFILVLAFTFASRCANSR
jgi:hypothetical protein